MILPIDRIELGGEHLSSRPQGLILDEVWHELEASALENGNDPSGLTSHASLNGQLCTLSISHDGDFATAVALVPLMSVVDGRE